jgi:hypothetical protein
VLVAAFADPRTVTLATLPPAVSAPVVALLATSVVDAYVVARRRAAEAGARCPHCGRPVDSDLDLDFCEWCTEPLDRDDEDADADADGAGNVGPTDARRAR